MDRVELKQAAIAISHLVLQATRGKNVSRPNQRLVRASIPKMTLTQRQYDRWQTKEATKWAKMKARRERKAARDTLLLSQNTIGRISQTVNDDVAAMDAAMSGMDGNTLSLPFILSPLLNTNVLSHIEVPEGLSTPLERSLEPPVSSDSLSTPLERSLEPPVSLDLPSTPLALAIETLDLPSTPLQLAAEPLV